MSICPKCGASVDFLTGSYVDIRGPDQNWVGISCVCPKCEAILGVSLDASALKNEVAQEVVAQLQGPRDDGS